MQVSDSERDAGRGKRLVLAGIALAVVLDTASQLLWKVAATRLPVSASATELVFAIVHDPFALVVAGVFLLQLVNWLLVLKRADLSYAQPLTSLSYVSVCLLSVWMFGERLDASKLSAVALILLGVLLIGKGPVSGREPT